MTAQRKEIAEENRNLRIAFFGTSPFAVGVLTELERASFLPALIVTAPDKRHGRGMEFHSPVTAVWAAERGIEVLQPERLDESVHDELRNSEWDVFIVAAYGMLLPQSILELPAHGTLNVHPSLLPRWRGPSPIQAAIREDQETGVTIMLVDEKMDHGPIVAQARIEIEEWPPTAGMLGELLAAEGGKLLAEVIPLWIRGDIVPEPQKHEQATFCKKMKKEDCFIDLPANGHVSSGEAEKNFRKIQACSPRPGAYFFTTSGDKKTRIKITGASFENNALVIYRVIPEGKREMNYQDFLRGSS